MIKGRRHVVSHYWNKTLVGEKYFLNKDKDWLRETRGKHIVVSVFLWVSALRGLMKEEDFMWKKSKLPHFHCQRVPPTSMTLSAQLQQSGQERFKKGLETIHWWWEQKAKTGGCTDLKTCFQNMLWQVLQGKKPDRYVKMTTFIYPHGFSVSKE